MSHAHALSPCAECWHVLVVSFVDAAPANELVQQACGGDVDALFRFFDPSEWLKQWALPLTVTWGTAEQWRVVADMWRVTRSRKDGRFLSLAEINAGWDGGLDG
jgi:hypothetical protein